MNKKYLDSILSKYDLVISEAAYRDLLNPPTRPFEKMFTDEPLAFTMLRALELANQRTPDKETTALLTLIHAYFDDTDQRSLSKLKENARRAADHIGLKYLLCLEFIARQYGYQTWNGLIHSGNFRE